MLQQSSINYLNFISGQPLLNTLLPAEARTARASSKKTISNSNVEVIDTPIKTRDGSTIIIRNYEPKIIKAEATLLYIHGGGWVINSIETSDASCIKIVEQTGLRVVSVNYRLAPEYKFPIPLNDCHDAFKWLLANEKKRALENGSLQANPIFVAGDSAGANLASALIQLPLGHLIAGQILLYPVAALSYDSPSYTEFAVGYGLEKSAMEWFGEHYVADDIQRYDPLISLLNAKLENVAPAFVIVAEYDVLRDEGIAYAEKLALANGQSQLIIKEGLVHSYFTRNEFFNDEIEQTIIEIERFVKSIVRSYEALSIKEHDAS